ncbi:MAG: hypothetical protein LBS09_02455 [Bacteroidales bacterium]|nr:hypothetical protein [Bacteroidales bacterium]
MGHYRGYTEEDFTRLLEVLSKVKGRFLLSSYPSEVLSQYVAKHGWTSNEIEMRKSAGGGTKTKVLTMNYSSPNAQQLKLFIKCTIRFRKMHNSFLGL